MCGNARPSVDPLVADLGRAVRRRSGRAPDRAFPQTARSRPRRAAQRSNSGRTLRSRGSWVRTSLVRPPGPNRCGVRCGTGRLSDAHVPRVSARANLSAGRADPLAPVLQRREVIEREADRRVRPHQQRRDVPARCPLLCVRVDDVVDPRHGSVSDERCDRRHLRLGGQGSSGNGTQANRGRFKIGPTRSFATIPQAEPHTISNASSSSRIHRP